MESNFLNFFFLTFLLPGLGYFHHLASEILSYLTWGNYLRLSAYLVVSTSIFFVVIMGFKRVENQLPPDLLYLGKALLALGLLHNLALNVLVCTLLFLDIPRGTTTTGRLNRYWRDGHPGWKDWRKRLALVIRHRLDLFDPRGLHE